MSTELHPWYLHKSIELVEADPTRAWTIGELATSCGVARRTLQKHFRRDLGCTPVEHIRWVRLQRARQELLRAPPDARITGIAAQCGFNHLGRFATWYRARYGETPSATLHLARMTPAGFGPGAGASGSGPVAEKGTG
ncbi:MAG: helix-turn-helix transcriptional regulator [Hyphomicrobiaceae bacterium]|nr:MAG: helix-turn-helix transcriptional regulator [Hyphomicrobiaceae bacterium]